MPIQATVTIRNYEEDSEEVLHLPGRFIICDRCEGTGGHDPEAFSNGFTQEDFDEEPDFKEEYLAGRYDVRCECCDGTGKQIVPDLRQVRFSIKRKLVVARRQEREIVRDRAADAYTRRMESGGY